MAYDPRSNKYRGDQYMRKYTKQNKNKRTYEEKDSDTDMESRSSSKCTSRISSTYASRPNFETNQYEHNSSSEDSILGPVEQAIGKVRIDDYINANKPTKKHGTGQWEPQRLDGDLKSISAHIRSEAKDNNAKYCVVCNGKIYSKCSICNVPLHFFPRKGDLHRAFTLSKYL